MRQAISFRPEFEDWRKHARLHLQAGIPPEEIDWQPSDLAQISLFPAQVPPPVRAPGREIRLPQDFLALAQTVACIRGWEHWPVLYRFAYRLLSEGSHLMQIATDPDLHRLRLWEKSIRRDIHKMHAFVRFKLHPENGLYVAWYEPDHRIVRAATPFFSRRFGDRPWSIFTPDESASWNMRALTFGKGITRQEFDAEDPFDLVWREYYRSAFNPARVNIKAMQAEMPQKFWKNLPEASVIREAIRQAPARVQKMAKAPIYLAEPPATRELSALAKAARGCESCPLHASATQTVFGTGPANAALMIVGEQLGDEEDRSGSPFVGPAGQVLREALSLAGIPPEEIYLTNSVKHFKWSPSERPDKPRLHKTPSGSEVSACRPWFESEIGLVKPQVLLALGRTAGLALLGRLPNLHRERGSALVSHRPEEVRLSWHPSAILRACDENEKSQRFGELVEDLRAAWASARFRE